ncbi:MAG TPA: POTRA domain-containing protein [Candidatus Acidoferrales bacterium]|nr:POTRA domain-containing protein [Candidatus Acidoferrales bacterium]
MPKRYAAFVILIMGSLGPAAPAGSAVTLPTARQPQSQPSSSLAAMSSYVGRTVKLVELPGVPDADHLLQMVPQKAGQPLDRDQVRDSIRVLFSTGRFADIQAEVTVSGTDVILTFTTSLNFFVGAVDVEGAPGHPSYNQILNASKLQFGELHTLDKLNRSLQNIRQLMQENGYYRASVTAESTSNAATQQVSILFHITAREPAHVGEVKVSGHASFSQGQVQDLARLHPGERVTAARITNALQHLRKKLQKQQRVLAQVSIAEQKYRAESNAVDYTFLIEPGPVVVVYAQGFHVSRGTLKKEIPIYQENAFDDDLLNEGKRNLLNYLQSRGHFDASVDFQKETTPDTVRITYRIDPGPVHKLELVEITGNKYFSTQLLRQRLQIQPAGKFFSPGRYSEALLKNDVTGFQALYLSNGFRQAKIQTKIDDNYRSNPNHLAVHIRVEEGPQTLVGAFRIVGNQKVEAKAFPELNTAAGQPYSEQSLASDRDSILNYYFNHGFSKAVLDIITDPTAGTPDREDVTYSIQEGVQFFVNHVMVAGLEHTRDYVVQREVQVIAGKPLSQQDLLDTQTKLYDLSIFSQVDTAVQNPEGSDPQKNVAVQVQEARRYTFTYGLGLEFETGLPSGTNAPAGSTGVSPRVGFDVTRLNVAGRDQTLIFQSHVGTLQQRGLISYEVPKIFNNDRLKLFYTIFYDNSLNVSTFTSQRLEGKIDLRQQIGKLQANHSTFITYLFDYRRVKASSFASNFSPAEFSLFSLPAHVGGPGFTFIRDRRDNPLESTKGQYFTLDGFAASSYVGSQSDYARALAQHSTYYGFGRSNHKFVFARSTTLGLEQVYGGTRILPPGSCPLNNLQTACQQNISIIPLPELFFAGGGNSHRGFGLNQAGPRDPDSGFPVGGSALFVNSEELRFPSISLPYLGEGFGFALFHDMGNVFTAGHDMLKGLMRWHQPNPSQCLQFSPVTAATPYNNCVTSFDNSGYDYTSHAVGIGLRYKTPIGPLRFDFGYNLNPTVFPTGFTLVPVPPVPPPAPLPTAFTPQHLQHFNIFFSIGQPF